jgi:tetratricopeptide (TPR) repeat protein
MKPFRRTQVITIMAACAISTALGQQLAGPPQEPGPAQADQDFMRSQIEAARQKGEQAREAARQKATEMRESLRQLTKQDAVEQARKFSVDAVRMVEDRVWKGVEDLAVYQVDKQRYAEMAQQYVELAQQIAPVAPLPPMPPMPAKAWNFNYSSGSYESGKSALENHNYEKAVEIFDKVINARTPSTRADGAYYWKAYALNKLGKRDEALAALAELSKQFPQSGWLNDAKALQVEVQQAKGQPVSPENQADEDLKLYAINALINSDADRAVPLLEGLLGNPKMSPRLKERALFVLAQSRSDKAHEIVGRYAKGGSNPDLQLTAVQYLGTYRSKESRQLLSEVYGSVGDVNVKRAVLRSFEMSRDIDHLSAIAKSEQNVELRREAIRQLGNIRDDQAVASLVALYGSESDKDIKSGIINSLGSQGAAKQIIECARKESDPELKKVAVRRLSDMRSKEATDFLMELLK